MARARSTRRSCWRVRRGWCLSLAAPIAHVRGICGSRQFAPTPGQPKSWRRSVGLLDVGWASCKAGGEVLGWCCWPLGTCAG